jgi:hypothetical protein
MCVESREESGLHDALCVQGLCGGSGGVDEDDSEDRME